VVASPSIRLKPSHKAVGWSRAINSQCAHRRQDRGTIEPKLARPCVSAASPAPLAGARTAFAVIESLARRHLDPFCVAVAGFHPPIVRSLPCTTCDPPAFSGAQVRCRWPQRSGTSHAVAAARAARVAAAAILSGAAGSTDPRCRYRGVKNLAYLPLLRSDGCDAASNRLR
jgi:hypothetical protein